MGTQLISMTNHNGDAAHFRQNIDSTQFFMRFSYTSNGSLRIMGTQLFSIPEDNWDAALFHSSPLHGLAERAAVRGRMRSRGDHSTCSPITSNTPYFSIQAIEARAMEIEIDLPKKTSSNSRNEHPSRARSIAAMKTRASPHRLSAR